MKKNYTISIPRSQFWTIIVPLALLFIAVGGIGGIVVVDRFIMPRIVGISTRGIMEVPMLVNKQWEDARQELYDIGLRLQISGREYSDSLAKGIVMSQQPEAGETVKRGRHVCVVVSEGSEVAVLPDVRRLTERIARNRLRDEGFNSVVVHTLFDEKVPKDQVIGTEPPHGIRTSRELTISLRVSKGPQPTHATVPNVIGEMLSDAKLAIEENGLAVGRIEYRTSRGSRSGTVVSQSTSPGTSVPLESSIDLVVAADR